MEYDLTVPISETVFADMDEEIAAEEDRSPLDDLYEMQGPEAPRPAPRLPEFVRHS